MSYLDIVRTARKARKVRTGERATAREHAVECEISEISEISPLLTASDAERLKAEIVAAATVESAEFDRSALDALWARWNAHEAAGGAP